jgi:hypothetical protein
MEVGTMSRLSQILDQLIDRVPRRVSARGMWRCLVRKPNGTIRNVGRELEILESRDVPTLLGQQLFPSDNPWNQNIANAPVAANSAAVISQIGGSIKLHPDWGDDSSSNTNDVLYGIPFNVVHGNSVKAVNVIIDGYSSESDIVPVPIPANAVIEGDYQSGPNLNGPGYANSSERGDSHLIIWDEDNNIAYELYGASRPSDITNTSGQWTAIQETVWNMNTDTFRTLGYTSADAAGLSILAGLVRPDEGLPTSDGGQGAIDHALRFTLPSGDINPQYIYPASHEINVSSQATDKLPMGARLRLEDNPTVDALIAKMGPEAQIIATAMQQYGLILADDGSPMFVTGASASVDANNNLQYVWNMDDVLTLESLTAGDFQVVSLTPVVTGISESTGSVGDTVTITGQNFSGAAGHLSVFFGANQSQTVTYVSDTEITAVVPSGSGQVNVTVQSGVDEQDDNSSNPNANVNAPIFGYGTSATSSADLFTYGTVNISPSYSSVGFASSSDVAGAGDLVTFIINDNSDNPVAGLPSTAFSLSLSGGTSSGSFGAVTETSTPGTYTATFTGGTAGTASTLTTEVEGVQLDSQPAVQVTPGSVSESKSTVSFANSSDVSGSGDKVTITVEDAEGNPITGLVSNDFAFSLAGGVSTGTFGTVTETGTTDTYTATFTGILAGSASTLTLKINSVALAEQPKVTVTPGGVSAGKSTVGFASPTVAAGNSDTVTIFVADAAGNAITDLTNGDFVFSLAGGTSTGTFGSVSETATHGTYTATFTGSISGTVDTLSLKVNGVPLNTQPQVSVTPSPIGGTKSTVSFASSTDKSGLTDTVTIVVEDAAGDPVTGLSNNAFNLALTGGTSTGTFGAVSETATKGTYTATFTGATAGTASSLISTIDDVQLATEPKVTVLVGPISASTSSYSFASPTVASGKTDLVTIIVKDAGGNAITGLAGTSAFAFTISGGKSSGTFSKVIATSTPGTYTSVFTATTAGTVSDVTLKVKGILITQDPTIQVTPGAVNSAKSTVSVASTSVASGNTDLVTIVVKDADNNAIGGLPNSDFSLGFSGGKSSGTFGAVEETSTPGTYTVFLTGVAAGTASTLTVKVNGVLLTTEPKVTVKAGTVSGQKSTLKFASPTVAVGQTDMLTITVEDAAGNAITGLANTAFAFQLLEGTSKGSFGTVAATTTPGVYTVVFDGTNAGTMCDLLVKVNGVSLVAEPSIQVT